MIWCGYFNAHSTLWGSKHTDTNGNMVEQLLEDKGLVCLNDRRGTRIDARRGLESSIDLTLVYELIARVTNWDVFENTIGSDHYPIVCEIRIGPIQLEDAGFPRWKLINANWTVYNMLCSVRLKEINPNICNSVNDFNVKITEVMHYTAVEVPGKGSGGGKRKMVPLWSDECKKAIQARNKALKNVKVTF